MSSGEIDGPVKKQYAAGRGTVPKYPSRHNRVMGGGLIRLPKAG